MDCELSLYCLKSSWISGQGTGRPWKVFVVQSFFERCHDFGLNDGQNNKISSFRDEFREGEDFPSKLARDSQSTRFLI